MGIRKKLPCLFNRFTGSDDVIKKQDVNFFWVGEQMEFGKNAVAIFRSYRVLIER